MVRSTILSTAATGKVEIDDGIGRLRENPLPPGAQGTRGNPASNKWDSIAGFFARKGARKCTGRL